MVDECQSFPERSFTQVNGPRNVDCVLQENDVVSRIKVGIGEIDVIAEVVVADRRMQQHGLGTGDQQLQVGQIAGIAIEQPVLASRACTDIAVAVEYGKCIVMLQIAPGTRWRAGVWNVEGCFCPGREYRMERDVVTGLYRRHATPNSEEERPIEEL